MTTQVRPEAEAPATGWGELLRGGNLLRSLALSGGVAIHAVNLYLATTILPSVVRDIGGIEYYAWNTTVYVVTSIVGAAVAAQLLTRAGPRTAYAWSGAVFALASVICATAGSMPMLLAGRSLQGLAGGVLVALPYALVRIVFRAALWPRALAMVSGMWGVSTLLGPALGGVFAELGAWRAAFWSLLPLIAVFVAIGARALPARDPASPPPPALPWMQLLMLTLAVLAASIASVVGEVAAVSAWLVVSVALMAGFDRAQRVGRHRLLPRGSLRPSGALGVLYAMLALLAVAVTCTEIFVPLFLQDLHGRPPLQAGYIAALMSVGWTLGSILTSGLDGVRRVPALRLSPVLLFAGMTALAILMPQPSSDAGSLWILAGVLVMSGFGVGIAYPHLSTQVLTVASADEAELAASSIMTVQLSATAFGAALAGLVVNLAGQPAVDGVAIDTAAAARWLFAFFALAPAACLWLIWKPSRALAATVVRGGTDGR